MTSIQCPPLPVDTAQAIESAFGREHPYMKMGDALGAIWEELNISELGFKDSFLTNCFYPYSLMTIIQYWEFLTDRQMSQATRTRLDMKYAMHLPVNFPGIDPSMLCEFRQRILADWSALETLQWLIHLLNNVVEREKLAVGVNRMVAAICLPTRAEHTFDCMSMALEAIAASHPHWLKLHTLPHWYKRYHLKSDRLKIPSDPAEIKLLILSVGNDGRHLLGEIEKSKSILLYGLPEVQTLVAEWRQQFIQDGGVLKFREPFCLSCNYELNIIRSVSTRKEDSESRYQ